LPRGVACAPAKILPDKSSALLFLTATDDSESWAGPIQVAGKAKIGDAEVARLARAGSVTWTVPDYNNEAVRPRLTHDLFLAVSGVESAPITVEPAENKVWEAATAGKLQVPLKLTRRGDFSEALKLKAVGVAGLDGLKELDVDGKTNSTSLEIDLGQHKLAPGAYTFYLQTQTKGRYRNNPEAAKEADENVKQAEKLASDLSAEAKKAAEALAEATQAAEETAAQAKTAGEKLAEAKTAADKSAANTDLTAVRDAAEKEAEEAAEKARLAAEAKAAAARSAEESAARAKEAEAKKAVAADRAKAANERAKPRDATITVYSVPIRIQVNAEEKK